MHDGGLVHVIWKVNKIFDFILLIKENYEVDVQKWHGLFVSSQFRYSRRIYKTYKKAVIKEVNNNKYGYKQENISWQLLCLKYVNLFFIIEPLEYSASEYQTRE